MTDEREMTDSAGRAGTVQVWVVTPDTAAFLAFVTAAFDGVELGRVPTEDGGIGHAEVRVGDSVLLAFDAQPTWPPTPALLRVIVDDADEATRRAVAAGAREVTRVMDNPWGQRGGRVRDPLGNIWWVTELTGPVDPEAALARMADPEELGNIREAQETLDRELGGTGWASAIATSES